MNRLERWALVAVSLPAAASAHIFCNWLFRCGCGFLSASHCNIHTPGVPDCPWCTTRWAFAAVILSWIVCAQLGITLARRATKRLPPTPRAFLVLASGAVALALGVALSGAVTYAITGYRS